MTTTAEPRRCAVEVRSIDYVPLAERHGKLWHLGPLWFMSNAQIATLAVGVLGVGAGGNLIWSLIAIVAGVADRHVLHGRSHSRAGPAARAAADDPVAAAVRLRRRDPGVAVRLPAVRRLQRLQHPARRPTAMHTTVRRRQQGSGSSWARSLARGRGDLGYDFIHRMEQGLTYGFLLLFGIFTIVRAHAALPGRLASTSATST